MSETSQDYDAWVEEELKKDKNAKKTDFYPDKDLATRKKEAETPPPKDDKGDTGNEESGKPSTAGKIAKAGADLAGQMAAAHRHSWAGYKGGSTGVVDSSKNMTAARGPSDVLSKAERKRLDELTGGYG